MKKLELNEKEYQLIASILVQVPVVGEGAVIMAGLYPKFGISFTSQQETAEPQNAADKK